MRRISGILPLLPRLACMMLALGVGLPVGQAQDGPRSERAPDVLLDFERGGTVEPLEVELDREQYHLKVTAWFNRSTQSLHLSGTFQPKREWEAQARLSYQLYEPTGELLNWDGIRFEGREETGGERTVWFEIGMPILETQPWRRGLRVQFNAVVEGQYWFNEAHPEFVFPLVELKNIPVRDHYRAAWVWLPRVLPAQTQLRIPVSWHIGHRDEAASGFVASMDVERPDGEERVEAKRVEFADAMLHAGRASMWLPLGPLASGTLQARPGLVWDDVRWYHAEDWFGYQPVCVVPPLAYVAAAISASAFLVGAWIVAARWRRRIGRSMARGLVLLGGAWVALQLLITGYWIVIVILGIVAMAGRMRWTLPGSCTYAVTWSLVTFVELYWGRMSGVALVQPGATWLAVGGWALVLLPMVWIRPTWLRRTIATLVVAGWLGISTAAVVYYQFFQDFPSVENLLYAGQVGELGDSITSLVQQRHLIPFLVTVVAVLIGWKVPAADQRKTQIENT